MTDHSAMRIRIDPAVLRQQIDAVLAEFPDLFESDEELRVAAIESETELFECLGIVLDDILEAASTQDAIAIRIRDLQVRKSRFARREEACRKLMQQLMEAGDLRKAMLPSATLSIRPSPQAVRLVSPDLLPEPMWRVKREPNLGAIREALKSGQDVPGAALSNAADCLAILKR